METVEVMYNGCYGGFELSQEAAEKYMEKTKMRGEDLSNLENILEGMSIEDRQNKIMIEVVKELGPKASTSHSNIKIRSFPLKYANHIEIHEYDGSESLSVNLEAYKLSEIDRVASSTHEDPLLRIQKITGILREELEKIDIPQNHSI